PPYLRRRETGYRQASGLSLTRGESEFTFDCGDYPMELNGEQLIPAPRHKVWAALNDPEILRQCIPGCESVTKTSETEFEAAVQVRVGPVKAKFKGKVALTDLDPPSSCIIVGEAQGGVAAGFGKGSARVELTEAEPDSTR